MKRIVLIISLIILTFDIHGQEKIHLHVDKDIYLPGETVWFKSYHTYNNLPSYLSTNFYIKAYADDGMLIAERHYPIFEGVAFGNIELPDSIITNTVRLRVSTMGGVLFDSTNYYERIIKIYQPKNLIVIEPPKSEGLSVSFFAEGQTFIANVQNEVTIKSVYLSGMPAKIRGKIIEVNSNNFIDSFFTNNLGFGKMIFIPEKNKKYVAVFKDFSGLEKKISVVDSAKDGILFHCEKVGKVLFCNILFNNLGNRIKSLNLIANWGSDTLLNVFLNTKNKNQWVYKIPLDSFPEGLIELKLFDSIGTMLNHRTILNKNFRSDNTIQIKVLQSNLEANGKNKVLIMGKEGERYNLSISVFDFNFNSVLVRNTIEEDLWLPKQILPNFKFYRTENQDNFFDFLNQTVFTTSFNLFTKSKTLLNTPLDNYLEIIANYQNKNTSLPLGNVLNVIINDKIQGKQFLKFETQNQKEFKKNNLIFFDSAQISYQLNQNKDETSYIKCFLSPFKTSQSAIPIFDFKDINLAYEMSSNYSQINLDEFIDIGTKIFNKEHSLKEVVVTTKYNNPQVKRLQELDNKYTSGMFSGLTRGFQLNVIDDKSAVMQSDILNYIVYRIPGLKICSMVGARLLTNTRTSGQGCSIENAIITFVDETELPQQIGLSSLQVSQIAYVKYISGIVIGSSFVSNAGALYVYTKKGDDNNDEFGKLMNKIKLKGYDLPKNFTIPDFDQKEPIYNFEKRTTLYWNPSLILENGSNFEIDFNNNSISKKLLLIIEGFSEDGKLVHLEKIIE